MPYYPWLKFQLSLSVQLCYHRGIIGMGAMGTMAPAKILRVSGTRPDWVLSIQYWHDFWVCYKKKLTRHPFPEDPNEDPEWYQTLFNIVWILKIDVSYLRLQIKTNLLKKQDWISIQSQGTLKNLRSPKKPKSVKKGETLVATTNVSHGYTESRFILNTSSVDRKWKEKI